MELKRIFRGPLLLVLLAVLVITITLGWANSGSSYTQVDTGRIVQLIEQGQVKSAVLTDKNQTIQITTNSGQEYEADFISGQGQALQQELQAQYQAGKLPGNYNVQIPKTSTLVSRMAAKRLVFGRVGSGLPLDVTPCQIKIAMIGSAFWLLLLRRPPPNSSE